MVLKNYEDRLDFLNRNIDKINKAVSDFLGFDVNFEVRTFQVDGSDYLVTLRDDTNIRDKCGTMSKGFESVRLSDFGIWWNNDFVCIVIDCVCLPIIGGDLHDVIICKVFIVGDEVSVRSAG